MILVTGSTGMVGARLLFDLVSAGHQVRAIKRDGASTRIFDFYTRENPSLRNRVEWVHADLLDRVSMETACAGITDLFHCAALISFDPAHRSDMEKVNIRGTADLVNICLEQQTVRFFAFVSSVATLGRVDGDEILTEDSYWDPSLDPSHYAITKYGGEREVWRGMAEGLDAVIVNPGIILGPGDWHKGSPALFSKVLNGFPFFTRGVSGFVDVRDVSDALIHLWNKKITGQRYILSGENLSFDDLFRRIASASGTRAPFIPVAAWITGLVWPLERLRSIITGKPPFITRETARSSRKQFRYSSEKIRQTGFRFRSIDDCIRYTVDCRKKMLD